MAMLTSNKINGDDLDGYITRFQQLRKATSEGKDKAKVLEMLYDTMFAMGLKDYAPQAKQVDEVFGMKVWPAADHLIDEWTTFVTVKGNMGTERERKAGMVDANSANIADGDEGRVAANAAKFTRSRGGRGRGRGRGRGGWTGGQYGD